MAQLSRIAASKGQFANRERSMPARLQGRWLHIAHAGWYITAILAVLILIVSIPGHVLVAQQGFTPGQLEARSALDQLATALSALMSFGVALVSLLLAGLIFRYRSNERIALFVSFYLMVHGIVVGGPLEILELYLRGSPYFTEHLLQPTFDTALGVALLSLFPDGRFVPGWTRWLILFTVLLTLFIGPLFIVLDFDFYALFANSVQLTLVIVLVAFSIYFSALYAQYLSLPACIHSRRAPANKAGGLWFRPDDRACADLLLPLRLFHETARLRPFSDMVCPCQFVSLVASDVRAAPHPVDCDPALSPVGY